MGRGKGFDAAARGAFGCGIQLSHLFFIRGVGLGSHCLKTYASTPRGLGTLTIGGWCAQRNSPGSSTLGCPPLAGALLGLFLGINAGTGIGFGRH